MKTVVLYLVFAVITLFGVIDLVSFFLLRIISWFESKVFGDTEQNLMFLKLTICNVTIWSSVAILWYRISNSEMPLLSFLMILLLLILRSHYVKEYNNSNDFLQLQLATSSFSVLLVGLYVLIFEGFNWIY